MNTTPEYTHGVKKKERATGHSVKMDTGSLLGIADMCPLTINCQSILEQGPEPLAYPLTQCELIGVRASAAVNL